MTDSIPQDDTPQKRCASPACHQWLPATSECFSRDRSKKDGLRIYCKVCETAQAKARYAAHHPNKKQEQEYESVSEEMKRCCRCKNVFPATPEFFQRDKQREDGLRPDCKGCRVAYHARSDVRERHRTYCHTRYSENRDEILAQRKDNYHNDPEVKQYALDWNKRPEVRAYQRTYLKEYNQRPEGKAKRRVSNHTYRARKKAVLGTHTPEQIRDLLKRQKCRCYYCNAKFEKRNRQYIYHIEHTFPISRVAGTDIPANDISYLVLACHSCNRNKGDKFPWEFPEGGKLL